jgi:uncharacterized lipoprotein YmbA
MKSFSARLGLLTLVLALAGCGGLIPGPSADPTHYYILTGPAAVASDAPAIGHWRVGLKTVALAAYLKSPDLIVREGTNEIALQDYARWGEPLEAGISRLLQERLRASPAVGRVYAQPFPLDADRDYDVAVTVLRCEGGPGPDHGRVAQFAATIEIATPGPDARVVARRTFVAPAAAWEHGDFAQLTALLSADVDALGQDVVAALPPSP